MVASSLDGAPKEKEVRRFEAQFLQQPLLQKCGDMKRTAAVNGHAQKLVMTAIAGMV